jgi:hypothetical protein
MGTAFPEKGNNESTMDLEEAAIEEQKTAKKDCCKDYGQRKSLFCSFVSILHSQEN